MFRDSTCSGCGHLVLSKHVSVRQLTIKADNVETGEVFGAGCDPGFDLAKILPDGTWTRWTGNSEDGWDFFKSDLVTETMARVAKDFGPSA